MCHFRKFFNQKLNCIQFIKSNGIKKKKNINNNKNIEDNSEIPLEEEKVLVKQQYDNVLSKDEKKALKEFLKEEKSFKDQIIFLKKKKEKERGDIFFND